MSQAPVKARPTRTAYRTAELPAYVAEAIGATDYGHIDPKLDKLME